MMRMHFYLAKGFAMHALPNRVAFALTLTHQLTVQKVGATALPHRNPRHQYG